MSNLNLFGERTHGPFPVAASAAHVYFDHTTGSRLWLHAFAAFAANSCLSALWFIRCFEPVP